MPVIESDFYEATCAFQAFLVANGYSSSIAWVFRDGVTQCRHRWLVDVNTAERAGCTSGAAAWYERGRRKGLGLVLQLLGEAGGVSYCYIWVPHDEHDAATAMLADTLRFAIYTGPMVLRRTQNRWWFGCIRFLDRLRTCDAALSELPLRDARNADS